MNRPVFPRIPESRRRAQERAAARAHIPTDTPVGARKPPVDPDASGAQSQAVTDTTRSPGSPDNGAVR